MGETTSTAIARQREHADGALQLEPHFHHCTPVGRSAQHEPWEQPDRRCPLNRSAAKSSQQEELSRSEAGGDIQVRAAGGDAVSTRRMGDARLPWGRSEQPWPRSRSLQRRRPTDRSCDAQETQTSDRASRTAYLPNVFMLSRGAASAAAVNQSLPAARRRERRGRESIAARRAAPAAAAWC